VDEQLNVIINGINRILSNSKEILDKGYVTYYGRLSDSMAQRYRKAGWTVIIDGDKTFFKIPKD
jgi:hypothetical protein